MTNMIENGIKVCEIIKNNGFEAYFVGGCIRDMKMNTEMKDVDITTNATPEDIHNMFNSYIDTGIDHGTVSVRVDKDSDFYEVTTYRIDGKYDDGRHPNEVIFTPSLTEDLARRDFTMNAIAYDPITNITVDPFNGEQDIKDRIVRCVGNAKSRFMEDPLRVLRAMRFAIKYRFNISSNTKEAMHDREVLNRLAECISKERITDELRKMLTCGQPIHDIFVEFMDVIGIIIPEMILCFNAPHNNVWHKHDIYEHILYVVDGCNTNKFEIKLAALLHDIGKPACRTSEDGRDHFYGHPEVSVEIARDIFNKDLVISNKEKAHILTLIEKHDIYINDTHKGMTRLLSETSEEFMRDWLILKWADLDDHKAPAGKENILEDTIRRYNNFKNNLDTIIAEANALKVTDLKINGRDIMEMFNIKPGPEIGRILKQLFEDVLDEKCVNEREALLERVKTLV